MCGITAYAGDAPALPFLMQGLEKLEYRGYDSAGVTLVGPDTLTTIKAKGRLAALEASLETGFWPQKAGIGHTRWATHGIPSHLNSHPHENNEGTIAIVHNGIIENYQAIRSFLMEQGCVFHSQTDSEVIVHMLDYYYQGDMLEALCRTVRYLEGSFALCVVCAHQPDTVWTARKDSPMVLGRSGNASFCASDIPALLAYTREIAAMEDGQIAVLRPEGIQLYDFAGQPAELRWEHVQFDVQAAQKGGYGTFMEKEIHEQPHVVRETLRGRGQLEGLSLEGVDKVYFVACGTAWHAALYAQSLFRKWSKVPSWCIPASEFRYGDYPVDRHTLCIFVSQSGETADTLAAMKLAKAEGAFCVSLSNVLGSSLSRASDLALYTCAGPEISVASTKAYTTQLVMLTDLVMGLTGRQDAGLQRDLERLPEILEQMLEQDAAMERIAGWLKDQRDAYFIGRQMDYFSVLEGALKLKEVSYIHADAYYAGELKHGPIALIEEGTFVLALATDPETASKTLSNIQETIARGARVVVVTVEGQKVPEGMEVIRMPEIHPALRGVPAAVLLQLLAFHAARIKGCDVDKPRNLAKSVTVE